MLRKAQGVLDITALMLPSYQPTDSGSMDFMWVFSWCYLNQNMEPRFGCPKPRWPPAMIGQALHLNGHNFYYT